MNAKQEATESDVLPEESESARPSPRPRAENAAAETSAVDEKAEPAEGKEDREPPTKRLSTRYKVVVSVLALLVVAAGTGVGYLLTRPAPPDVQPTVAPDGNYTVGSFPSDAGQAAVRAAAGKLPTVLTYDYRSLDAAENQAAQQMTSSYAGTFRGVFDKTVKVMAAKQNAVTRALVRGAGLVNLSDDDNTATCLVYVDEVLVSSNDARQPAQVSQNRVSVTMKHTGDGWLIDNIQPF
ncbi:hypothetical protein HFP15_33300 [Amycolatopsis sp. K13G38]|uniref:Mce-associated membrane protein n=1 Tax=Amycolatopsis acididurans TaxID=2724524 RepID=A0ABX1JD79_9PSEU|nr:hypothetical protein [Amycolatopsis acididurans]NKQ57748.1 hypothetical protein [Amycolatopsis acididurans]